MVYYICPGDTGIERYAETTWDTMDFKATDLGLNCDFANPSEVHKSAKVDKANRMRQGYLVTASSLPKKILWANGTRPLPDVLPGFVVSSRFKDIIEHYESNVHQFEPVSVYKARDGEAVATYYWFIIGQRLDSVDPVQTTYIKQAAGEQDDDWLWSDIIFKTDPLEMVHIEGAKLVFGNSKVAGHHVWHDPHLPTFANGLCSDAIADSLLDAKLSGLRVTPRTSV
jgi:hypothetical protein